MLALKNSEMVHTPTCILSRVADVLNQNISDPDFSIPEFCECLDISRTHLHRKLIELTGVSTSHYIRNGVEISLHSWLLLLSLFFSLKSVIIST